MGMLLFYLLLVLSVNFICSVLEAVLLSMRRAYIQSLPDSKHKQRLLYIKEHTASAISSILILNTIGITMGTVGVGAQGFKLFGEKWETAIAVVLTLLILYVAEIIPKTIGTNYWKQLAHPSALLILFFMRILRPFLWISDLLTRWIKKEYVGPSREEIAALVDISEQYGLLDTKEELLIHNLLKLKSISVQEICTPRSVVFALKGNLTVKEALAQENTFIYSRIPIYADNQDTIVGQVFSREVLRENLAEKTRTKTLESIAKPAYYVDQRLPVYYLLFKFIQRKEHLFIVKDKDEKYIGIVTLEDAIETLLGVEIVDEVDTIVDMQQFAKEQSAGKKEYHSKIQKKSG